MRRQLMLSLVVAACHGAAHAGTPAEEIPAPEQLPVLILQAVDQYLNVTACAKDDAARPTKKDIMTMVPLSLEGERVNAQFGVWWKGRFSCDSRQLQSPWNLLIVRVGAEQKFWVSWEESAPRAPSQWPEHFRVLESTAKTLTLDVPNPVPPRLRSGLASYPVTFRKTEKGNWLKSSLVQ